MAIGKQRPIPPDLWTDEDLIELPLPVKWTAIGLRMHADDQGRETVTDWMLRPSLWPGGTMSEDDLVEHLLHLDDAGYIGLYSDDRRTYYVLREWPSVSHPRPSKHPPPPPELFQRFASSSPEDRSAWGGGGEGGPEGGAFGGTAGALLSPFCRVHQPNGSGGTPCRACGDARRAYDIARAEARTGEPT